MTPDVYHHVQAIRVLLRDGMPIDKIARVLSVDRLLVLRVLINHSRPEVRSR